MSDFEDHLARSLRDTPESPDEAFVARVADLVGAEERARIVRLSLATVATILLACVFCYGLALTWNASRAISIATQDLLSVAISFVCIFVFILSLPLAFARE